MITSVKKTKSVRCAIYTRKSTKEGLEQEFNSLDAQREAAESFIDSQRELGWQTLPDPYDDGGFTGGNTDRPALQRLIENIKQQKIDCVVVYKVDRLSRSLLDFSKLMELFEKYDVAFVSVTQHFNTATSMGRLILNVLLSFAQFERELISERVRDKMGAARRKGKWLGSHPVLGYDGDRQLRKLVPNENEAQRVRDIFGLYLELGSFNAVVDELNERCWRNKAWTTKSGNTRGGRPFTKGTLAYLLTNPVYTGKVRYENQLFDGEHEAIVATSIFKQTQKLIETNRRSPKGRRNFPRRKRLAGIVKCGACGKEMTHSFTTKANRRYRYYFCSNSSNDASAECKSVPAAQLEQAVFEEIWSAQYAEFGRLHEKFSGSQKERLIRMTVSTVLFHPAANEIDIEFFQKAQFNPQTFFDEGVDNGNAQKNSS